MDISNPEYDLFAFAAVPEAWKARISYTGTPPPPQGFMKPLLFNQGDVIEILEKTSTHWYMGRLTRTGEKGMVPSSHVVSTKFVLIFFRINFLRQRKQ